MRYVLSCADIISGLFQVLYFISGSVTVDRRLHAVNAVSKKENNTEVMFIHFLIRCFVKSDPLTLDS